MQYFLENHIYIVKYAFLMFFVSILIFLLIGWLYGRYRVSHSDKVATGDSLSTAIYGLTALVLAFSFSSATDHYDKRMSLIHDQAHVLKQVYKSSNYLSSTDRLMIQNNLKQILTLRISKYQNIKSMDELDRNNDALEASLTSLNEEINKAIARAPASTKDLADTILRTQLSHLIDIFQEGVLNGKRHPPQIIDRFLFALLSTGALLSGYMMAVKKEEEWFLTSLYLGLMGISLYVIFALEFPHLMHNPELMNEDFLKLQRAWQ